MAGEFVREESLGWLVAALASAMSRDLDAALKREGLSLKYWPSLMCLWEREGVTQAELSRTIKVAGYTTTRTIDRLEELGFVERRADPNSRRAHNLYLTARGRALEASLTPLANQVNARYLEHLKPAERTALLSALRSIVEAL